MKPLVTTLVLAAALSFAGLACAKPWWLRGSTSNEDDFLPPDVAFRVSATAEGGNIQVRWAIAEGYYLYRQKLQIEAESPNLVVSGLSLPKGTSKTDPYLGTQEIYTREVRGTVAYTRSDGGAHPLQIKVTYQGCAEAGLCYPPISKAIFPSAIAPETEAPAYAWERYAILGGGCAFFLAGLLLRKGRRLDVPG